MSTHETSAELTEPESTANRRRRWRFCCINAPNSIAVMLLLVAGMLTAGCSKEGQGDRVEYTKPDGKKTSDVNTIRNGDVSYQVLGGRPVPPKAEELHREARTKGESGEYASAIALLKQAAEIAPDWPYPRYDMAYTYLLQGDTTNALLNYRETDRLEPKGFFTTKTALWTLEREDNGVFPKGTYLAYVSLEWLDPGKKQGTIEWMTTNVPTFAPAWKEMALLVQPADQRLQLIERALSLDPDPETYGICMLNKAALLSSAGKISEAKQMAEALVTNASSTLGTKALANEFLKTLAK